MYLVIPFLFFGIYVSFNNLEIVFAHLRRLLAFTSSQIIPQQKETAVIKAIRNPKKSPLLESDLRRYKFLYHRLHNLERNSACLPEARDTLLSLFGDAVKYGQSTTGGILRMTDYNPETITAFIREQDDEISERFEAYVKRREKGGPRELLETLESAKQWLIQRAPSKYVDGSWLGHIHRVTTPFHLRSITKNAWQVLSEELGDGDLSKNHAQIYRELMDSIGAGLPDAGSIDFIDDKLGLSDLGIWKGATAQLLISLFPHDLLPEILGFNMHFECLTWETLLAAKELKELRLNDSYFLLHISIDNGHSGHTAMATKVVIDYLELVKNREGEAALRKHWKRVQVGYLLSAMFTSPLSQLEKPSYRNEHSETLLKILKDKSSVSQKLHCGSRVKLGSKKLGEWLGSGTFSSKKDEDEFLDALSQAKPWIRSGDGAGSRLVKELEWEGKMFGAFTESEIVVLKNWIDALASTPYNSNAYSQFIGELPLDSSQALANRDIRLDYPVFLSPSTTALEKMEGETHTVPSMPIIEPGASIRLACFLPAWFAHASLLEGFVSVPFATCSPRGMAVVRALRAQYGFLEETDGVAGMDEMMREDSVGLIELGLEMSRRGGRAEPKSLKDALGDGEYIEPALTMLAASMNPIAQSDMLLGMAWSFVGLHEYLGTSGIDLAILSTESKGHLLEVANRERAALRTCLQEVEHDDSRLSDFCMGVRWASGLIAQCFD